MTLPRTFTQARREGWIIKGFYQGRDKVRVDLTPRFYNGGKSIIGFWMTYSGIKRLGIKLF